ncbi:MAG: hypothetical protein JO193_05585 [Candidatus Eremiobacteraeota bacterium]|nr:hypothetical protein [Candidatus Eremiobacteraeota bacterium]
MRFSRLVILIGVAFAAMAAGPYRPDASKALAQWFNRGRCIELDQIAARQFSARAKPPPLMKSGFEVLQFGPRLSADAMVIVNKSSLERHLEYAYDARAGIALRHLGGQDCCAMYTLRFAANPPIALPPADLSGDRVRSGLKLGMSSHDVIAALGEPLILKGCGVSRYVYRSSGPGDQLSFTIQNGRIVEIYIEESG